MKNMSRSLVITLCFLFVNSANAALLSRLSGAAYYDDVLDVTWLANANLAMSNTFGVSGIGANGSMNWYKANEWIAAMNSAGYQGASDWRLPAIVDTDSSGCNWGYSGTDCGYNVQTSSGATVYSEMAHLFYETLGNFARYDTSGLWVNCPPEPVYCLTNAGPFSNLQPNTYWSGTTYLPDSTGAWAFGFGGGGQGDRAKSETFLSMAVRSGDILALTPVPLPSGMWLMGSALAILGLVRNKLAGTC